MFKNVRVAVDDVTNGQQLPVTENRLLGDFSFLQGDIVVTNLPATGPPKKSATKENIPSLGSIRDVTVFRDPLAIGDNGPEMVVIPSGRFHMGDLKGTGDESERPVHWVEIEKPFAIGKYEVTFGEYDLFSMENGRTRPYDQGWGRGNRPVINISWKDAMAYTKWLSDQTGEHYRLPSEAEWEYAARAETKTVYWWGKLGLHHANCRGCGGQWEGNRTAPVGSFKANKFGLYDTSGNVWEWVEDSWHDDYINAPEDGSAWMMEGDDEPAALHNAMRNIMPRVMRGGSFADRPNSVRSATRFSLPPISGNMHFGFRLARTLE